MDHSPNSPDFEPTDFLLFGPLKKHLAGKKFVADANVKWAVTLFLQTLDIDFFHSGI